MPVSSTPSGDYPFYAVNAPTPGTASVSAELELPAGETNLRWAFQLDLDCLQGEEFLQVTVTAGGTTTPLETNLSNGTGLSVYGGSPAGGQPAYSASGSTGGWSYVFVDLAAYAGQTVTVHAVYTATSTAAGAAFDTFRFSKGEQIIQQDDSADLVLSSVGKVDAPTTVPDIYFSTVTINGTPTNGGSNTTGDVSLTLGYHYQLFVNGSDTPSSSGSLTPFSVYYTIDGGSPVNLDEGAWYSLVLTGSSVGTHELTVTAQIETPDGNGGYIGATYTWTRVRAAAAGGWDWTAPENDIDPWAGVDINSAGIQVNGKALTAGGSGSAVLSVTSFEGQWSIPGLKGSEIDLEGLSGVIPVGRLSQAGTFTLPLELDADTVVDFYREFDLVNALAGEQGLSIRVLRPTGEIRYQDNCSLPGQVDWTVVDANIAASCSLAFLVPYPYWRSGERVSITVGAGEHDLTALAGSNARNELLTLTCLSTGRITDLDTGSYIEAPSGAILDCAKTAANIDLRPLRRNPDFARLFVLGHRGGTVPRVKITGSWKIEGYKRFKTA